MQEGFQFVMLGKLMENLVFRTRPDERNECEQWTLIADEADGQEYVVQEHVKLDALRSGAPYLRLVKRMTVAEFLGTDQPAAVKIKLQAILGVRSAAKG